jgi:serine/threonine-protein kinase RsbW
VTATEAHDDATLCVMPGPIAAPVLARVIGMLAARVDFSVDRLNDTVLVADALAAHTADHAPEGRVQIGIATADRAVSLRVGPLVPGGGEGLLRTDVLPDIGSVLDRLADEITIRTGEDGEYLLIRMTSAA